MLSVASLVSDMFFRQFGSTVSFALVHVSCGNCLGRILLPTLFTMGVDDLYSN